jgi:hypothetical protein
VSAELPTREITPLRAVAYFIAVLVLGTGALLVIVASDFPAAARIGLSGVSIAIAGVMVLLVHQPLGQLSISAAILVVFSLIFPPLLIHETPTGCHGQVGPTPCDPGLNSHLGLQVGLMAALAGAALLAAIAGATRSSR